MTRADRHQTYMALCRCASELRGIASRLGERGESAAAQELEAIAVAVAGKWSELKTFKEGGDDK